MHDQWIRITNPGTNLVKAYQTSTCFQDVYHYITDGKLPSGAKAQACIQAEALIMYLSTTFCLG